MDIIYIRDLKVDTVIGLYDWERRIRQTIRLDLDLGVDICQAAASDSIADTLDYKAVAKRLIEFAEQSEFLLVETLAERIAAVVMQEFGVPWLWLRVNKKGALRGAQDVGVIIERGVKQPG